MTHQQPMCSRCLVEFGEEGDDSGPTECHHTNEQNRINWHHSHVSSMFLELPCSVPSLILFTAVDNVTVSQATSDFLILVFVHDTRKLGNLCGLAQIGSMSASHVDPLDDIGSDSGSTFSWHHSRRSCQSFFPQEVTHWWLGCQSAGFL